MEHSGRSRRDEHRERDRRRRQGSRSRSRDRVRRRERKPEGAAQPAADTARPADWRGPATHGPPPADWRGPNSHDSVPRDWRGPPPGMGMGMYPPPRGDSRWGLYPGDQARGPMPPHYGAPVRPGMPPPWGHPPVAMQHPRPDDRYRNDPPADWPGAAIRPGAADMWGAPRPPPPGPHASWSGTVPPPSGPLPAGVAHGAVPNPGVGDMDKPTIGTEGPSSSAATGPAPHLPVDGVGGADGVTGALTALFAVDSFGLSIGEGGVDFDDDTIATRPKHTAAERLKNIPIVGAALSQKTFSKLEELDVLVSNPVGEFSTVAHFGSCCGGGTSATAEEVASVRAKCVRLGLEGVTAQEKRKPNQMPARKELPVCTAHKMHSSMWQKLRPSCGSAVPADVSTIPIDLKPSKAGGNVLVPLVVVANVESA